MPNVSDQFADDTIARAVNLQRFGEGVRAKVLGLLKELERDLTFTLADFDFERIKRAPQRYSRLQELLRQTKATIASAYDEVHLMASRELKDIAEVEGKYAQKLLTKTLRIDMNSVAWNPKLLETLVDRTLIDGAPSRSWWAKQSSDLRLNFEREMRLGILRGDTNDQLVRRVRGTATGRTFKVQNSKGVSRSVREFSGGIMDKSTREATALVRSSVQAVAQESRTRTYEENDDILDGWQILVTLDGRTCPQCAALSGGAWDFEGNPLKSSRVKESDPGKPPYHMNDRCQVLPVTKSWADLVDDPALKTRLAEADVSLETQASMDGQVASELTYEDWLKTKDEAFQREVLGPARFKLWSDGKLGLQDLVASDGRTLTLDELNRGAD